MSTDQRPSTVRLERHGPVAHVVLDRPGKLNSLNLAALSQLRGIADEVGADGHLRAVVVRGEGRAFCTGVDLGVTSATLGDGAAISGVVSLMHETLAAIESSPVPWIAAVHGMVCAGGLELTLACDLVIAAEGTRLADFHARYGLFPGGGASQRLPRLVGDRRARWLLLSGEWIDAETAALWGLVNEVVAPGQLIARADDMAELLARRSPRLAEAIKQALEVGARTDLATALMAERPIFLQYMASADARTGMNAFESRSEPEFGDR